LIDFTILARCPKSRGKINLKHTFGRRLRAAGVSFEDRQDLLGHKSTRITTHYSAAELRSLWEAVNKVCVDEFASGLAVLRNSVEPSRAKFAQTVWSNM